MLDALCRHLGHQSEALGRMMQGWGHQMTSDDELMMEMFEGVKLNWTALRGQCRGTGGAARYDSKDDASERRFFSGSFQGT